MSFDIRVVALSSTQIANFSDGSWRNLDDPLAKVVLA